MVCPNKSSIEWIALENAVGEYEAYRLWINNNNNIPPVSVVQNSETFKIYKSFKENLPNVTVIENVEMETSGRVVKDSATGNPTIEINPNYIKEDTLAHEFSHVYIDLMGGSSNSLVNAAYLQLRGTDLHKEIERLYPDLSEERFKKEVVAQGLGKSIMEITSNEGKQTRLEKIFNRIFDYLSGLLGLNNNAVKDLANKLVYKQIPNSELNGVIDSKAQEQRVDNKNEDKAEKELSDLDKIIAKASASLEVKYKLLKDSVKFAENPEKTEAAVEKLRGLKANLDKLVETKSIAEYTKAAIGQTTGSLNRILEIEESFLAGEIEDTNKTMNTLGYLHNYIQSFKHVNEFISVLEENISNGDYKGDTLTAMKDNLTDLRKAESGLEEANRAYIRLARKMLSQQMADKDTRVIESYKIDAEREFNLKTNLKGKEKKEALQKYIAEYLENNKEQLRKEQIAFYENYLKSVPTDISTMESWIRNSRSTNDTIVQNLVTLFDKQDRDTREDVIEKNKQAAEVFNQYKEYMGSTQNMAELYEPLFFKFQKEGSDNYHYELARPGHPKYADIKLGKYKGTAVEAMYDFLVDLKKETDKKLPPRHRLGKQLISIDKNTKERLFENGILSGTREAFGEMFKQTKSDVETGSRVEVKKEDGTIEVLTDAKDQEFKEIPIHYRGFIEEKDMSFDLLTNALIDFAQATNYRNKLNIFHTVEATREVLLSANIEQVRGFNRRKVVSKNSKLPVGLPAQESNLLQAVDNLIDQRLYGISTTSNEVTNKVVKKLKGYVSLVSLGINYLSGPANYFQGRTMVMVDAVSGDEYTPKDTLKANLKFGADSFAITKDLGADTVSSMTNLLLEKFDALSDWAGNKHTKFADNNRLRRMTDIHLLTGINTAAEYQVQAHLMYSILNAIKTTNENGEFIDKDGNVVEEDAAMTLDEAFTIVEKNGVSRIVLDEKVKGTNRTGQGTEKEIIDTVTRIIGAKNRNLFGNYRSENKTRLGRTAVGSLIEHMRKWMGEGLLYIYGGAHNLFYIDSAEKGLKKIKLKSKEDLKLYEQRFSEEQGKFKEGIATTTIRFLAQMMVDVKNKQGALNSWKSMTMAEKKRVYASIYMSAIAAMALAVSKLAAPDDDDEGNVFLAFYTRRLYSELAFYSPLNVNEMLRVTRSPAVAMGMADKTVSLISQLMGDPFGTYERGVNKGESKVKVKFYKITPLNVLYRDIDASLNFLEKGVKY